jgi:hypothetical protein
MISHERYTLVLLAVIALSPIRIVAQDPAQDLGTTRLALSNIVDLMTAENAERAKTLAHFQGRREYQLDYKGFPKDMHAEMVVNISYDAPSTEVFTIVSQSGPKWMINRVLKQLLKTEQESIQDANRSSVQITGANYNFTLLESHDAGDGCPYILSAEPKVANKFLFRGKIWVDAKDFAVCRIEAEPAKNPSFWIKKTAIHHLFLKVDGFWLPAENKSVSDTRFDGRATLTIKYEDYKVQTAPALQAIDTRSAISH